MSHLLALLRRLRAVPTSLAAVVAVLGIAGLVSAGTAGAHGSHGGRAVPPPPANPTSADQIQNIDQVKTAIKAYYGDTTTPPPGAPAVSPTDGTTTLHYSSQGSAYDNEMGRIAGYASAYLRHPGHGHGSSHGHHASGKKAIVLDVDDTTLNTYNYEIFSNFVYSPIDNGAFVNAAAFPAVFHMVRLVNQAKAEGYTIFFLTGRPASQATNTEKNLRNVGYPVKDSQVYLKDLSAPWLKSCAQQPCTTIQYKSLTRKHIESLGYRLVGNFGDQYSDLSGGYADKTFKLPNPMYYLP